MFHRKKKRENRKKTALETKCHFLTVKNRHRTSKIKKDEQLKENPFVLFAFSDYYKIITAWQALNEEPVYNFQCDS